ncbi:MAG: hypothetical protein V4629_12370 [Pseudomonadota bacterium]
MSLLSRARNIFSAPPPSPLSSTQPNQKASNTAEKQNFGMTSHPMLKQGESLEISKLSGVVGLKFDQSLDFSNYSFKSMRDIVVQGPNTNSQNAIEAPLAGVKDLEVKEGFVVQTNENPKLVLISEKFEKMTDAEKAKVKENIDEKHVIIFGTLEEASKYISDNAINTGYDDKSDKHTVFLSFINTFLKDEHNDKSVLYFSSAGAPLLKVGDNFITVWKDGKGNDIKLDPEHFEAIKKLKKDAEQKAKAENNIAQVQIQVAGSNSSIDNSLPKVKELKVAKQDFLQLLNSSGVDDTKDSLIKAAGSYHAAAKASLFDVTRGSVMGLTTELDSFIASYEVEIAEVCFEAIKNPENFFPEMKSENNIHQKLERSASKLELNRLAGKSERREEQKICEEIILSSNEIITSLSNYITRLK